MWPKLEA